MGHFAHYGKEKAYFLITGCLFWGSGGCRRWSGCSRHTEGNNGATVQPNAPAPVRKVQRGVFSTFLFRCSGIITRGNKEPFKPTRSSQGLRAHRGVRGVRGRWPCTHPQKQPSRAGDTGNKPWVHRQLPWEPQLQWGGSSQRATLLVSTPRQKAKSKPHPASWHPSCSCCSFRHLLEWVYEVLFLLPLAKSAAEVRGTSGTAEASPLSCPSPNQPGQEV